MSLKLPAFITLVKHQRQMYLRAGASVQSPVMKLHYDPYQIFCFSKTPAGLYARQKWMGDAEGSRWQSDFQETVDALRADQLPDGSWQQSAATTIIRLFGLHLTVRSANRRIEQALTWLLEKIELQAEGPRVRSAAEGERVDLSGLPFVPSRPAMLWTAAPLFLCSIFGRSNDPLVLKLYRWLCNEGITQRGQWFDVASSHNIFRALVVHPRFAADPAVDLAVERFSELQTDAGDWGSHLPFYQTLNALAHLKDPAAENQLEKAFARLTPNQNSDGTWGRREPEWNTFLAVHALKNKGLL